MNRPLRLLSPATLNRTIPRIWRAIGCGQARGGYRLSVNTQIEANLGQVTSTRAEAAYKRAVQAFKAPTLDLLHGRYAPFVVAVLSIVFTPEITAVALADAHAEIDEILDELRAAGYDDDERGLPKGNAREICRYWVRVGWLGYQIEDDVEVYRLSAHAVGALEVTGRAGGGRGKVSKSRVRTLLEAVEDLSADAQTDPEARLARLRAERSMIEQEIMRLESGNVEPVDDEQLIEEAENIVHLAREIPADFARVAESIKAMQRDVITDLRQDIRPTGEVLREYLRRGQDVMESTPEGRAFSGALRLIGDPEQINLLTSNLNSLAVQPFMSSMDAAEREQLATLGRCIEQGVEEVLTAQRRASHVITAQVRTHDPIRDRQVDDLLRDVMAGLQSWMQMSRSSERVDVLRSLPIARVGHLRQTLGDVRSPGVPAPLTSATDVEFLADDSRYWGGPHYQELEEFVNNLADGFDLAEAFDGVDESSRRPVDLLGLLEIVHRTGMVEKDEVSVVETMRPDGTTRRFAFGAVRAKASKDSEDE